MKMTMIIEWGACFVSFFQVKDWLEANPLPAEQRVICDKSMREWALIDSPEQIKREQHLCAAIEICFEKLAALCNGEVQ